MNLRPLTASQLYDLNKDMKNNHIYKIQQNRQKNTVFETRFSYYANKV